MFVILWRLAEKLLNDLSFDERMSSMLVYHGSPWFIVSHGQTVSGITPHVTVVPTLRKG